MHDDVARKSGQNQAISYYRENSVLDRILETAEDIEHTIPDSLSSLRSGSAGMIVAVAKALKKSTVQE